MVCLCFMVFNATFNNISVISWPSILLVEKIGVPGENHWPAASHWQTLSHNVYQVHLAWTGFELTTLVVIGTDCTVSCKSNCHTITTSSGSLGILTWVTLYVILLSDRVYNVTLYTLSDSWITDILRI
jgi:hypothetical protein